MLENLSENEITRTEEESRNNLSPLVTVFTILNLLYFCLTALFMILMTTRLGQIDRVSSLYQFLKIIYVLVPAVVILSPFASMAFRRAESQKLSLFFLTFPSQVLCVILLTYFVFIKA